MSPPQLSDATLVERRYRVARKAVGARKMVERGDVFRLIDRPTRRLRWVEARHVRSVVDELLDGLSMLHLAGIAELGELEELGIDPDAVMEVLHDDAVRIYSASSRMGALPTLLRECLHGDGEYRWAMLAERSREGWSEHFARFVALDATFRADTSIRSFLALLDDEPHSFASLDDLHAALADRSAMRRWLDQPRLTSILEGLQDLLSFSEELNELLASMTQEPIFRGLIWMKYARWYGAHGARLLELVERLCWTLELVGTQREHQQEKLVEPDRDFGRERLLLATVLRLVDVKEYPRELFEISDGLLDPWRIRILATDRFP